MEPLTLGLIDASISAMRTALQDEPELLEQVDLYVNELRTRFNIEAVGLCFSHYIGSDSIFKNLAIGVWDRSPQTSRGLAHTSGNTSPSYPRRNC